MELVAFAPGALDLEVEAAREALAPEGQAVSSRVAPSRQQGTADIALVRGREGDQAGARVGLQPVARHQHLAKAAALEVGARQQAAEIAVTGLVAAQDGQPARVARVPGLVDPEIGAHQRLDAALQGAAVKLHHREQVDLVGDRDRRHAERRHPVEQGRDADDAVRQRILGMHPQMDESRAHAAPPQSRRATGPKERRCAAQGPRRNKAARCSAVG